MHRKGKFLVILLQKGNSSKAHRNYIKMYNCNSTRWSSKGLNILFSIATWATCSHFYPTFITYCLVCYFCCQNLLLYPQYFFQNYLRGSSCWCLISRLIYMSNLKNESQWVEYLIIYQNNHIGIEVNLFPCLSIAAKIVFLSCFSLKARDHSGVAQLKHTHLFLPPNTIY